MTKPATLRDEELPHAWYPGRSQADVHHRFSSGLVAFQMGEVVKDQPGMLRTVGRARSNLLKLLNITPTNPDSFIVRLPVGPSMRELPCDQCSTLYGWDRIFKYWRLLR